MKQAIGILFCFLFCSCALMPQEMYKSIVKEQMHVYVTNINGQEMISWFDGNRVDVMTRIEYLRIIDNMYNNGTINSSLRHQYRLCIDEE